MSKIIETTISNIGATVTGKTPSSSCPEDFGLEYMFVTPSDSFNHKMISKTERYLSAVGANKLKSKILPPKSILVTCIGSAMGKISMNKNECVTNQQINSIRVNTEKYDPDYIYYCLKNNYRLLRNAATGSTALPLLNKTDFDLLKVGIHSGLNFQQKIGAVLSALDSKIELNKRINAELEAMAKTLYDYWFVQFDFPNENGKPYKISGGRMVWNETLKREIPTGWNVESLKKNSLSKLIKPGVNNFKNKKTYLATADVVNNDINFEAGKITFQNRESRANMQPIENSIWFAKMKNSKKILYFGEYSSQYLNNFILSTGFTGFKCKKESLEYLWNFINRDDFEFIKDRLAGDKTTQSAINNDAMAYIPLLIPKDAILNRFHDSTYVIYRKIYTNQLENHKLAELRDWLLPMLMNGQVKVE